MSRDGEGVTVAWLHPCRPDGDAGTAAVSATLSRGASPLRGKRRVRRYVPSNLRHSRGAVVIRLFSAWQSAICDASKGLPLANVRASKGARCRGRLSLLPPHSNNSLALVPSPRLSTSSTGFVGKAHLTPGASLSDLEYSKYSDCHSFAPPLRSTGSYYTHAPSIRGICIPPSLIANSRAHCLSAVPSGDASLSLLRQHYCAYQNASASDCRRSPSAARGRCGRHVNHDRDKLPDTHQNGHLTARPSDRAVQLYQHHHADSSINNPLAARHYHRRRLCRQPLAGQCRGCSRGRSCGRRRRGRRCCCRLALTCRPGRPMDRVCKGGDP
ncbi:hypothetical protein N656DRAFT_67251 [Canariomyces notabilis]|uniref:Uncharacterized protein n=1 Tax=Canariomyces notabilis TaxID=2074819 RepID=A0AAN6YYX3_9PEZI|nr:hypothetical protein N656DRAFT_67251 [Canariomyces arenarius]